MGLAPFGSVSHSPVPGGAALAHRECRQKLVGVSGGLYAPVRDLGSTKAVDARLVRGTPSCSCPPGTLRARTLREKLQEWSRSLHKFNTDRSCLSKDSLFSSFWEGQQGLAAWPNPG